MNTHCHFIISHIRTAFAGVTREGGVSWSESDIIDNHGSETERLEARAADTDRSWTELVDSRTWDPDLGCGFTYLDAIGYRYYLPAAMIRCARAGEDVARLAFTLELPHHHYAGLHKSRLDQWSLLDDAQRSCVAAFVRFMVRVSREQEYAESAETWQNVLDDYWHQFK